jgi:insulysin
MALDVDQDSQGYHFSMNGYSQHLSAMAAQAAEGFAAPQSDQKRFEQARQKLVDALEDPTSKMPYEHGMQALSVVTSSGAFSTDDVVRELKSIDVPAFKAYLSELSAKGVRVELLSTGNMNETAARSFSEAFVSHLRIRHVLGKEEATQPQVLEAARGVEVRMPNPIPGDANSATINAYQYGVPDVAQRVRLLLLGKMINSPVYDELRTKQQLGYVVDAAVMPQRQTLQLAVIVQGEKESPDEVDGRIETVLDDFGRSLKNLSSAEFARWKASIRSSIDQDDQNMGQEADRLWDHIADGEECFNRKELALEFLDSFHDAEELANLAKEYAVFRNTPRKISIRLFGNHSLVSKPQPTSALQVLQGDNSTEKLAAYKGQKFFPAAGVCQIHRSV